MNFKLIFTVIINELKKSLINGVKVKILLNLNYFKIKFKENYFRLDRLFNLIEQRQSSFVRKTAAYQIGEIVKTHPNELESLLEKVNLKLIIIISLIEIKS
jgi:hypothetical protein